jgi:para-aminobenzoate synthetase component 1
VDQHLGAYEQHAQVAPDLAALLAWAPPAPTAGFTSWITPLAGRTPAAIYAAVAAPYRWLLESAVPGSYGRWSFITGAPFLLLWHRAGRTYLHTAVGGQTVAWAGDPFAVLQALLARYTLDPPPELPTPFPAGIAGYFGYDLRHWVERLARGHDDLRIPDCVLGFYDSVLTCNHQSGQAIAAGWGGESAQARWQPVLAQATPLPALAPPAPVAAGEVGRTFTRAGYEAVVRTVREHIIGGDIYQANLSQRFAVPYAAEPWPLYLRLRAANPAPFAAYLPLGEATVVSASPERFLQVSGRQVSTRPIKGTRPRGATPAEDRRLAAELRASAKDQAENVMIVDLLRNDLGRVCATGSVRVPELLALESYATVHHLVSTVVGTLAPDRDRVDLLRACWPGGSITGAPKIRAMQIINDLEPVTRGPYCGSIGYLSVTGAMDTSIVIRTALVQQGRAYVWAGGGLVADSDPAAEYVETLDKAAALLRALGVDPTTLDDAESRP